MKRALRWTILALVVGLAGCAGGPIRDSQMVLDIQPQPLKRGERAVATVNAPMDSVEVIGTVRVMGSPQAVFRKDEKRKLWYFVGTIPFSPWVKPGHYTLRVVTTLPEGKRLYTETPVDLR